MAEDEGGAAAAEATLPPAHQAPRAAPPPARCPPFPAQAAAIQWPEVFATPEAEAAKPRLVEQMRAVRPVVETG
jgi:hypothetical protein